MVSSPDSDIMTLCAGMFGWVKGSGFLSKVVERTKTVTENVITTLDPQMKEFIHSGGDIEVKNTYTLLIFLDVPISR